MECPFPLQGGSPWLEPASYETTGAYKTFEMMVRAHGRSSTYSFLLCSLFGDALGLPRGVYLDYPRSTERNAFTGRYNTLFTTFMIQP